MLTTEYGVNLNDIPTDLPNAGKFKALRPYEGKQYDLVFCDGQVLRNSEMRGLCEAARRTNVQLTLGLQRIKPDGTLMTLLPKLETLHTMMLVRSFSTFATIKLFKTIEGARDQVFVLCGREGHMATKHESKTRLGAI
jgi:hypothetical protein